LSYVGIDARRCSGTGVVVILTGPCLHELLVCHEAGGHLGVLAP
jgi:hypothetical protein